MTVRISLCLMSICFLFLVPSVRAADCVTYFPDPITFPFFSDLGGAQYTSNIYRTFPDGTTSAQDTNTSPLPISGPGSVQWYNPRDFAVGAFGNVGNSLFQACDGQFISAGSSTYYYSYPPWNTGVTVVSTPGTIKIHVASVAPPPLGVGGCPDNCVEDHSFVTFDYLYAVGSGAYVIDHSSYRTTIWVDGNGVLNNQYAILSGSASGLWPLIGCPVKKSDVKLNTGWPFSQDGKPITMNAWFQPSYSDGISIGLDAAAAACGFTGYNWQQLITEMPAPSGVFPQEVRKVPPENLGIDGSLQAPPEFYDPPDGGYTYLSGNSYPFYYSASELNNAVTPCTKQLSLPIKDSERILFQDCPNNFPGTATKFRTRLVGVCGVGATSPLCSGVPLEKPSPPLYEFTWESTFDGDIETGSGYGGARQTKSIFPIDPSSGAGGVKITSVNGVPQTLPSVSCSVTPDTLWPPNGKSVSVTVSGIISLGTSAIASSAYEIIDEYGQVQPNGSVVLGPGGGYSFGVSLIAARKGKDRNGRRYTIAVRSADEVGNIGSCLVVVTAPHDQR